MDKNPEEINEIESIDNVNTNIKNVDNINTDNIEQAEEKKMDNIKLVISENTDVLEKYDDIANHIKI